MGVATSNPFSIAISSGPAWLAGKNNRQWYQLAGNTMLQVQAPGVTPGNTSFADLTGAWTGAARRQVDKSIIWDATGGHAAYPGNEQYRYGIGDDAPSFALTRNPSSNGAIVNGETYSDGAPSPMHTRDGILCDPVTGDTFIIGTQNYWQSGNDGTKIWRRSKATGAWSSPGTIGGIGLTLVSQQVEGCCAHYSASKGLIYAILLDGQILSLNPSNGAIAAVRATSGFYAGTAQQCGDIIELNGIVAIARFIGGSNGGGYNSRLYLTDINNPASEVLITHSGGPGDFSDGPAFQWHPASKKFLVWGRTTNRQNIYTLAPANPGATTFAQLVAGTWTWAVVTPSGGSVVPSLPAGDALGSSSGTYKRGGVIFNVSATQDVFYVWNQVDELPYLYPFLSTGF